MAAHMADILIAVSRATGFDTKLLKGPGRKAKLSRARLLVYYYCRTESEVGKRSTTSIGKLLDRDHSTILTGLHRHETLMVSNHAYREWWDRISEKYYAKLADVIAERCVRQEQAAAELEALDRAVKGLDAPCSRTLHTVEAPETAIQCSPFLSEPQ